MWGRLELLGPVGRRYQSRRLHLGCLDPLQEMTVGARSLERAALEKSLHRNRRVESEEIAICTSKRVLYSGAVCLTRCTTSEWEEVID